MQYVDAAKSKEERSNSAFVEGAFILLHSLSTREPTHSVLGRTECQHSHAPRTIVCMVSLHTLVYCSILGFNFVSCSLKSSTVPMRKMLFPGYPVLILFMSVPQTEQNWFVIVLPEAIVLLVAYSVNFSRPRMYLIAESLTMKFEANVEDVSFLQSVQLQMNVPTRSSPSVGCTRCSAYDNRRIDLDG